MILLENKKEKKVVFCNDDLKHLYEFENALIIYNDNKDMLFVVTSTNEYILLSAPTNMFCVIRTDEKVNKNVAYTYEINDEETEDSNITYRS